MQHTILIRRSLMNETLFMLNGDEDQDGLFGQFDDADRLVIGVEFGL